MELYPFQRDTVAKVLQAPLRRWLISAEMGLGKTAMSTSVARELCSARTLIVGPAVTRQGWLRELETWWPGHPEAKVISLGRGREKNLSKPALERKLQAFSAPIQIVSYDLLGEVDVSPWDVIIFDEIHRTKNPLSQQSEAARAVARANPQAAILGLTGTPMPDSPCDIWHLLDLLWPERFGKAERSGKSSWLFKHRYAQQELRSWVGGSAWHHFGVNELYVPELKHRLEQVSTRITKAEVAQFLPKLLTQTLRIPRVKGNFRMAGADESALEHTLMRVGEEKIGPAVEWLEDVVVSAKKIVVFTYGVEMAERISARAAKLGVPVFTITGKVLPDKRQGIVDAFAGAERGVCVASMKSAGIGINGLDCATDVLFAELYYRPETLGQALGRFNRLSSKEPTTISLLVLEGTLDEAMAMKLQNKINAINAALKAGQAEEGLENALGAETVEDEERFLRDLETYSNSQLDENLYMT